MRTIAIVGAGEAGLPLAILLKESGYDVTLFTNRTSQQIYNGKILSSQGMFDTALQLHRKWKLNHWDTGCAWNTSVSFAIGVPNIPKINIKWKGKTKEPFHSVDQRLKFSLWQEKFKQIGGKLVIQDVGLTELNLIAKWHELTIVAGGKGEIGQQFPRDDKRSVFNKPMRSLACMYVNGIQPVNDYPGVRANIIPGIGEYFIMPGLTLNGRCDMMLFEGLPDGPFDCWSDIINADEQLERSKKLLHQYIPWEAEKIEKIQLTDKQATLLGRYTPIIRQPIAKMPCGKSVLGMGDTVVLNDPIAGQGANNAVKCAKIYFNSIVKRGNESFAEDWMQDTFEEYWQKTAKAATQWTKLLLLPPPPHVIELLDAASRIPLIADTLANGFDDPSSLFPWIEDPMQTKALIKRLENEEKVIFEIESIEQIRFRI